MHQIFGIYGIAMAFKGQICCWHVYGYSMVNKVVQGCMLIM